MNPSIMIAALAAAKNSAWLYSTEKSTNSTTEFIKMVVELQ